MNCASGQNDKDLFGNPMVPTQKPVVLRLQGIEVQYRVKGNPKPKTLRGIPSFKTGKTAFGWIVRDPTTGKLKAMARPLTLPHHKKWMELAILSIESQLRSFFGITTEKIQTVASPRSWIASLLPLDDSWTWCPDSSVKSRLCGPDEEEGAIIVIERIR